MLIYNISINDYYSDYLLEILTILWTNKQILKQDLIFIITMCILTSEHYDTNFNTLVKNSNIQASELFNINDNVREFNKFEYKKETITLNFKKITRIDNPLELMNISYWKIILNTICMSFIEQFDTIKVFEMYFDSTDFFVRECDLKSIILKIINTGFGIFSKSGNFLDYLNNFNKKNLNNPRNADLVKYFLEYYFDIPNIIRYTEKMNSDDLNVLKIMSPMPSISP